jgi:LuxR family maltose regulon positive regulatory protein
MRVRVLGRLSLESGGRELRAPAGQVGALLERLLLRPGTVHPADELIAALWEGQPADAVGRRRLRVTVSRLRQFLDDGDVEGLRITFDHGGYRLEATPTSLDRLQFEAAAAAAIASRAPADVDAALAQWAGPPYTSSRWPVVARAERAALERLRSALVDLKVTAGGGFARTSVRPPALNDLVLGRQRLLRSLPGIGAGHLIAAIAPAGFGKSTVLAQWAREQPGPVAWMGPTPEDDDPARLWALAERSLVTAGVLPSDHGERIAGTEQSLEALRTLLEVAGTPTALVVDDVHHLQSAEVIEALASFVQTLLAAGVTVALGSRVALPAELWRRVDGPRVHALDLGDLRFTLDEVVALFPEVERAQAERVWRTAEGWPIAIVSLIRAGAASRAPADGAAVPGDLAALAQYVGDEVIAALPKRLASFVLQIAPLDAFTVSLCDAVTGKGDAARKLTDLRRHGLFVVETMGESDLDTGWFRFHHGIGAELRRLARTAVDVGRVHQRAARWHLERGFNATALRYALAARDRDVIAAVAGDVMLDAVIRREFVAASALIRTIRPDDVVTNPRAHAVCFWIALIWLPQIERGPWLHSRARCFGEDDVLVLMSRANNAFREGRANEAVELCERTLAAAEQTNGTELADLAPVLVGITLALLVNARMLQGTLHHDDPLFARAISAIRPFLPLSAAFVYSTWALVAALDGNEAKARTLAQEFNDIRCTTDAGKAPIERTLIGSMLAASATADPATLRWIATELERGMERLEALGNTSQLAMDRLVAASIHRRAGDPEQAAHYQRLADSAIATFADAPVFDRLRPLLDAQDADRALMSLLLLGLSPRQRSILPYLGTDLSVGQIAATLHISVSTLRGHLQQIYVRLGVHSRVAAAARLARLDVRG